MELKTRSDFSYTMTITKDDCLKNGISFDMIKDLYTYKQNKHLYDKVPDYYFEPKTPVIPKKTSFIKRFFTKKERAQESKPQEEKPKTKFDLYFEKKFEDLKAQGLPLYSKADRDKLYQNENKLTALVSEYANAEAKNINPDFENRGGFSYNYEITENDEIIYNVDTLIRIL